MSDRVKPPLKTKSGRVRDDGYYYRTYRCPICNAVVYRCMVGNGAGARYATYYANLAYAQHQCQTEPS